MEPHAPYIGSIGFDRPAMRVSHNSFSFFYFIRRKVLGHSIEVSLTFILLLEELQNRSYMTPILVH